MSIRTWVSDRALHTMLVAFNWNVHTVYNGVYVFYLRRVHRRYPFIHEFLFWVKLYLLSATCSNKSGEIGVYVISLAGRGMLVASIEVSPHPCGFASFDVTVQPNNCFAYVSCCELLWCPLVHPNYQLYGSPPRLLWLPYTTMLYQRSCLSVVR